MKKILILFCLGLLFVNCSENDDPSMIDESMSSSVGIGGEVGQGTSFMGDFVSLAHPTSGKASVSNDGLKLTFTNFKTDSGPKLLVYLSTDNDATAFVNLGDLKGVKGDFTYVIPEGTDISKYKIVNIWCVDFLVSFGVAELKK